ncbi:MAG: PorV/PorQ family protein [Synergistaceae bacterium]|jgi:hypothetical protein|nr:PorV/PorQ family protein [Synergistaceae bacterium]
MKKRYFSTLILSTFIVAVSYSQSVSFLNTPSDARSMAMGNAGFILSSPFSVQHNSASVMAEDEVSTGLGASLLLWQPQETKATLFNLAGYHRINKFALLAGFRTNRMGEFTGTDANGSVLGSFSPSEYALEVGIAYSLTSNIAVGVSLRHLSSRMSEEAKSSALASDISMIYHHEKLRLGLGVSNLGTEIDYGIASYKLPARFKSGIAYQFSLGADHSLLTAADLFYQFTPNYSGIASGIGAEYRFKEKIAVRTGYHFESTNVGSSYATIGLGTKFSGLSLDLAYLVAQGDNPKRQTLLLSLKFER